MAKHHLDGFNDYVLGVGDLLYDGPDEFGEIVLHNERRPVRLYVYSVRTEEVRELTFSRPSPDGVAAVSEVSIQPSDCSRPPDYDRVEEVSFELKEQRLHDKGVVLLPVWAIEYTCLGQRYRGFVSGLPPRAGGGAGLRRGLPQRIAL